MYRLDRLGVDQLAGLCSTVRGAAVGTGSMSEAADIVTSQLYERLLDEDGQPAFALLRLYKSHRFGDLGPDLRTFALGSADTPLSDEVRCLVLMASRGRQPSWNDPAMSQDHRAIPLPSADMVARLPMVAGLLRQLGIEVASLVAPAGVVPASLHDRTYDVFYVPQALGAPEVPAQEDFVVAHGIESVLGFGGILASGDVYAVIGFSTVHIPARVAGLFRSVSLAVKTALVPHTFAGV